jgi:SAM-dependent methyltransferase
MRNIGFEKRFDVILNLFTSFGYFAEDDENEKVLTGINRALKPEGRFLLDYENKFFFYRNDVLSKRKTWKKIDDNTFHLIENEFDVFTEREILRVGVYKNGTLTDTVGYNIRLYSYPEITNMLAANGLEIVDTWGDYKGNPYSADSRRLIVLSKKIKDVKPSTP